MQAARARASRARPVCRDLGMVVKEGELRLVGVRDESRVVLPGKGEDGRNVVGRGCGLDKRVALAAEAPEDLAGRAGDEVDGVSVADRDEVVASLGL